MNLVRTGLALLSLSATVNAVAVVGPEQAARLGTSLTPLGGQISGNSEGTLPVWTGPTSASPSSTPLYVVTHENAARYAGVLGEGQRALLDSLPESYGLPVYPSRRQATAPSAFLAGTQQNAVHAFVDASSPIPQSAGVGIPFPILSGRPTEAGLQAIWNHRLRWRGISRSRTVMQITASTRGDLGVTRVLERLRFQTLAATVDSDHGNPVLTYLLRGVIEPKRLAGTIKLVYDKLQGPPMAWQRSPNQLFIQKTTSAGDDTAVIGAEGLVNEDQLEGFSGPPYRYDWKLIGTREQLVPYDADRFDGAAPDDIFGPRHIRPDLAHYELHRVHVIEARVKSAQTAAFPRRVFYLDEDSWQVVIVDLYDRTDRLVRVQEVHTRVDDQGTLIPTLETVYDLQARRYFASAMTNRDGQADFSEIGVDAFQPGRAVSWGRHAGVVPAEDKGER